MCFAEHTVVDWQPQSKPSPKEEIGIFLYVSVSDTVDLRRAAAVTVAVNNGALHLKSDRTVMCSVPKQDYMDQDFSRCELVRELQ